ncbi:hypothetical protein V2J09_021994 [Rumex salicifolius]
MDDSGADEGGASEKEVNFGLGFNDVDFSDRVLRLEITPLASNKDPAVSAQKRRRKILGGENVTNLKVTTLNICSLLLAAKSPFFYKLFKNGMRESQKKVEFTLRIDISEEAAFMDMLNSIYHKPLNATSRVELMDVLMAADKYEVTSCMRHCIELLLKLPMTTESALYYLEFPSIVFVGEVTRPLIDAAKQYLSSHFRGFTEAQQEEAMSLPLCAVEAVLDSADFQVNSEEVVFDFILKWARAHYPKLQERQEILNKRLFKLICFPCMSSLKLKEIVDCPDFDSVQVAKLAFNALFYKSELPHGPNSVPIVQKTLLPNVALANCGFPRRAYYHRRVVHFDLKKQECADMNTISSRIYSEEFCVGGRCFSLFAQKEKDTVEHFALFVEMRGSGSCCLSFELSAMKNPSKEFDRRLTVNDHTLTETGRTWGTTDLFEMPWTDLMRDDSEYIIDGVIHIRAQLTINN